MRREDIQVKKKSGNGEADCRIRLGLYDPDPGNRKIIWTKFRYDGSTEDRAEMRAVIQEYNAMAATRPDVTLCLAAFKVASKARRRHPSK